MPTQLVTLPPSLGVGRVLLLVAAHKNYLPWDQLVERLALPLALLELLQGAYRLPYQAVDTLTWPLYQSQLRISHFRRVAGVVAIF